MPFLRNSNQTLSEAINLLNYFYNLKSFIGEDELWYNHWEGKNKNVLNVKVKEIELAALVEPFYLIIIHTLLISLARNHIGDFC